MSIKDGGPAFHSITIKQIGDPAYCQPTKVYHRGMSLRDWFAGMALVGVLPPVMECGFCKAEQERLGLKEGDPVAGGIATLVYEIADAMLKGAET